MPRKVGDKGFKTVMKDEWLKMNEMKILDMAYKRSQKSDTILAKLVDKILPTLATNRNENVETFEAYLRKRKEAELKLIEGQKVG